MLSASADSNSLILLGRAVSAIERMLNLRELVLRLLGDNPGNPIPKRITEALRNLKGAEHLACLVVSAEVASLESFTALNRLWHPLGPFCKPQSVELEIKRPVWLPDVPILQLLPCSLHHLVI